MAVTTLTDSSMTRRNGQFFVIGALLLVTLMAGLVLFDVGGLFAPQTDAPKQMFDRSLDEFPRFINTVAAEDPSADHMDRRLAAYLAFQADSFTMHGLQSQTHTLVSVPHHGQDHETVSFVFANFRDGTLEDVTVTADGTTQDLNEVQPGETARFMFDDLPATFDVELSFTGSYTSNRSYTAHRDQYTAMYQLRTDGESQRWQTTRTY